jgi:hypothetical protein
LAAIHPTLFKKFKDASGLSQSGAYRRISDRARQDSLNLHQAALAVARDAGVNITRFASLDDLDVLRGFPRNRVVQQNTFGGTLPTSPGSPAIKTSQNGAKEEGLDPAQR